MDLGRRVALEVHVGQRLVQRRDRVAVEVEVDVRVLAVDHVDLGEPGDLALAEHVLDELLGRERVRVLLLARRRERAELALHAADVRLVDVEVLDEVDLVRSAARPARAGRRARRARAGRPTRGARGRPRSRGARRPRPSPGSAPASVGRERRSAAPLHDGVRQRLELVAPRRRRRGRLWPPKRSAAPARGTGRAHRSRRRGRARPPAARPRAPRARRRPRARRASSGSVGVPSRRSVPGTFPVSIVSPRAVEDVVRDLERDAEHAPYSPLPPPSTHAASKSLPVFSAQRSR